MIQMIGALYATLVDLVENIFLTLSFLTPHIFSLGKSACIDIFLYTHFIAPQFIKLYCKNTINEIRTHL